MTISIIIVNWNAGPALAACLDAVYQTASDFEIIVVDNASSDGSQMGLQDRYPNLRLVQNERNFGFAAACNQGLRLAHGDYLLWLNPDTQVQPQALQRMMELLVAHPEIGLVGPRIVLPDGSVDFDAARNFPSLRGAFAELTYLRRLFPRSRLLGHWRLGWWDHRSSRVVPCLVGACVMMRREVWECVGPLDETIPMYFEDIDYCYRVQRAGWCVYYLAEACVVHQAGLCSKQAADRVYLEILKWYAQWLYFRRYRSWPAAFGFRVMVCIISAMRVVVFSLMCSIIRLLPGRLAQPVPLAWRKAVGLTLWAMGLRKIQ